jgi:hypothetical protein
MMAPWNLTWTPKTSIKRRNWKTFFPLDMALTWGFRMVRELPTYQVRADEGPQHNSVLLGGSELRKIQSLSLARCNADVQPRASKEL